MSYLVTNPNGATVTIFAPYDCKNNCPFCVNKKEYKDNPKFDIDKVEDSMMIMNVVTPNCDFVITGGEPLADLELFDRLVNLIRKMNAAGAHHKLFVNTTLPVKVEDIYKLNCYSDVITGFNISRHIGKYTHENGRKLIDLLKIPVRINCVLYDIKDVDGIWEFIDEYKDYAIQFRENYLGIYPYNVYSPSKIFDALYDKFAEKIEDFTTYHYSKDTFRWSVEMVPNIYFHRTACFSTVWTKDGHQMVNDVIIDPRGEILSDWNGYGEKLKVLEYYEAMGNAERMSKILPLLIEKKV